MTQYQSAYGTTTYSTQPVWVLNCDELYYYGEPMPLQRGHLQTGYYSQHFDTEQQALDYIAANGLTLLNEPPPYRPENGELAWFGGEVVGEGYLRRFADIRYRARQSHTTQEHFTPDMIPDLWLAVPDGKEWMEQVWYEFGCVYDGIEYSIIQPHMSQVGYEPPNVPALWEVKETVIPEDVPEWTQPQPGVNQPFHTGDVVTFNSLTWVSDIDNNWYQPGLFGWSVVQSDDDLCSTAPLWNSGDWASYTVGFNVKHNNAIWKAINTTHTWIAPAHTGDGSISWEFVKDCP